MKDSTVNNTHVIVALDYSNPRDALDLVQQLDPTLCRLKVGKELFTASGPEFIEQLAKMGFDVFLDLKFHDIPTTVAKACLAAANLGVWMLNVHALGGVAMLCAARGAIENLPNPPKLIAVTILTSMGKAELIEVGLRGTTEEHVLSLAELAYKARLDGVVCSPMEAQQLRNRYGTEFILVTPGVRPLGSSSDDQARIMTPVEAISAGASYLVIGRPITRSKQPLLALQEINQSIIQT